MNEGSSVERGGGRRQMQCERCGFTGWPHELRTIQLGFRSARLCVRCTADMQGGQPFKTAMTADFTARASDSIHEQLEPSPMERWYEEQNNLRRIAAAEEAARLDAVDDLKKTLDEYKN